MLRARLVLELEESNANGERSKGCFPRFYHVLVPIGDSKMDGLDDGDQWKGVLNALKTKIDVKVGAVEDKIVDLENKIGRLAATETEKNA